jgi:hypothetical protein
LAKPWRKFAGSIGFPYGVVSTGTFTEDLLVAALLLPHAVSQSSRH